MEYHGCPVDPVHPDRRWCSTKTNSSGHHVSGQGKFGFCTEDCPSNWLILEEGGGGEKTVVYLGLKYT